MCDSVCVLNGGGAARLGEKQRDKVEREKSRAADGARRDGDKETRGCKMSVAFTGIKARTCASSIPQRAKRSNNGVRRITLPMR